MGTAAISDGDYIHECMKHADLILLVGHDIVEKPPFLMQPSDKRTVIHLNYSGASVGPPDNADPIRSSCYSSRPNSVL
jgi:acetolactate synthase I/II/III large subunit